MVLDKKTLVHRVFDSVASRYDLMNDLMSFGLHRVWKRKMLAKLPGQGLLLDIAGGTGDIAEGFVQQSSVGRAIVCDINLSMLQQGQARQKQRGARRYLRDLCGIAQPSFGSWETRLSRVCADAGNLPFTDEYFDYVTISFGIRNVSDISKVLLESHRVLKKGGRFVCMEFINLDAGFTQKIYDLYSFYVIPSMGKLVVGDAAPYQYLVDSIRNFPKEREFQRMILNAGFVNLVSETLFPGVAGLYCAAKY